MSDDHDFEPVPGFPERLPSGERLLWQGAPDWRTLAVDAFHVRKLAVYFALLLLWRGAESWSDGAGPLQAAAHALVMLPLAVVALGLVAALAWLAARTSCYSVTNRRVAMRVGIVLSVTFNLPFQRIGGAALQRRRDGHGDIALQLMPGERIAYLHLWPHARPWRVAPTEPMLRALPQAERVAALLSAALAESAGVARPAIVEAPATGAVPHGRPLAA